MGGAFLGGFGTGLANSLQQAKQRQVEEEYRKALIDQSKLATKKLENDLKLKEYEMQALNAAYNRQPMPPMPQLATMEATPTQPRQSIFGRIFNPTPPPPTPTVTPAAATQPSIPQMVIQGQMQGQMQGQPNAGMSQELVKDILTHKVFGLDPRLREQTNIAQRAVEMTGQGPMVTYRDKQGNVVTQAPAPPEFTNIPVTGAGGVPGMIQAPKHQQWGYIPTGPAPGTVPTGKISEEGEKKIREAQGFLDSINKLREYTKDPKDANLFGYLATQQHQMYQDPDSLKSAVGREVMEKTIGPPSPRLTQFRARLEALNSAIRYQLYAGNLAEREAAFYTRQAASATTQPQLKAVLDQMEDDFKIKMENIRSQAVTPPAAQGLPSRPQLPGQPWTENGVRYRINPATGKKQRWVD